MKNRSIDRLLRITLVHITVGMCLSMAVSAQTPKDKVISKGMKIRPDLFGLFFEDINYSADGGLYAELVQNRSFEYNPAERQEWGPFSFWEYLTPGFFVWYDQHRNNGSRSSQ